MADAHDIAGLELAVQAMRRLGVVRWNAIELGPDPSTEAPTEQPHESPETVEQRERLERRRVAFAASGGLVRALGHAR